MKIRSKCLKSNVKQSLPLIYCCLKLFSDQLKGFKYLQFLKTFAIVPYPLL